jgi:hypothetical protein
MPETTPFSAQVLLAHSAATGRTPQATERVRNAFVALDFEVGPCVGDSFAITGPAQQFRTIFGVKLSTARGGGVVVDERPAEEAGLPLHRLSLSLQPEVSAVVFSEPPAFGPGAP